MRASQVTQKWRILPASAGAAGEEVQCSGGEIPWRRKWQPTPVFFDSVFLPGKSHGLRSLVGYSPWSRKELDTAEHEHMVSVCDIDFCTQYQKSSMITTGSLAPISHCTTDPLCPFCPSLSLFNSCSNLVRRGYDCPFTGKETEVGEIKQQSKGQAALSGRARMPAIVTGPGHSVHFLLWFRSTWRSRAGSSSPSPSFLAPAHIFCKLTETKCPTSSSSSPQLEADLLNSCTRFGRLPGMFPSGQKKENPVRQNWDPGHLHSLGVSKHCPPCLWLQWFPSAFRGEGRSRSERAGPGIFKPSLPPSPLGLYPKVLLFPPSQSGAGAWVGEVREAGNRGNWHQLPLPPQPGLNLGIVQTSECQSCGHRGLNADIAQEQVTEAKADIIRKL